MTSHCGCYSGFHLWGFSSIRSPWCASATTVDPEIHNEGFCFPQLYAVAATTSVPDAFLGIWQLCLGSSLGEFSFSELNLPLIPYVVCCACYGVCFLLPCSSLATVLTNCWGLQCHMPIEYAHCRHMHLLMMVSGPHQECAKFLLLPLLWVGGSLMLLIQLFPSHSICMVGHTALGAAWQRVTWSLHLPYMVGGVFFSRLCAYQWHIRLWICSDVKPGDSSVVIKFQVDEFTLSWSVECFIVQSHIYPGFTGNMSTLTNFPL